MTKQESKKTQSQPQLQSVAEVPAPVEKQTPQSQEVQAHKEAKSNNHKENQGQNLENTNIVIGLMGKKGAGKDTIAKILIDEYAFTNKIAVTTLLKKICCLSFKLEKEVFESLKDVPFRKPFVFTKTHARAVIDTVDQILSQSFKFSNNLNNIRSTGTQRFAPKTFKTPRALLQFVGTDLIQTLFREFFPMVVFPQYSGKQGKFVITDMRFAHEAVVAGQVFENFYPVQIVGRELPHDGTESHVSESDWENIAPFFKIDNTNNDTLKNSLDKLFKKIALDIQDSPRNTAFVPTSIYDVVNPKAFEYVGINQTSFNSPMQSKAKFGRPDDNFVVRGWENE